MATFNVLDSGATGNGVTKDTAAIQRAVDACHAAGGGTVLVPAGRIFVTGTVSLRSNVELHVERGAVLLGSDAWEDYTIRIPVSALADGSAHHAGFGMLIHAERAERIAVTGGGVIDGRGRAFIAEAGAFIHRMKPERPFTFFLLGCRNVTFRDVTVRDGALWTVRLTGCEDVRIDGIRIENDLRLPNNDGIDLDRCRNVRISGAHIVSGDDGICLKTCPETAAWGRDWGGRCENVTVTGCTLVSTSSALIVGCEARAVLRNIVFDSCVVQSSHRGLAIHLSEESDIEDVLFSNMVVETRLFQEKWWGRGEPIYITAIPWTAKHAIGRVRRVRFTNVLCRGENGAFLCGWRPGQIEDVLLENVRIRLDKWSRWPGGRQDLRPCPEGDGLPAMPTDGFFARNVRGLTLRHCEVVWGQDRPDYFRHALATESVEGLVVDDFRGGSAHPDRLPARHHACGS